MTITVTTRQEAAIGVDSDNLQSGRTPVIDSARAQLGAPPSPCPLNN